MLIYVLDDGETFTLTEPTPVAVAPEQLTRIEGGEKVYSVVPNWDATRDYTASIVAAAPDLLEALKLLFKAWDCAWTDPEERANIYEQVQSAITKAEGGE
jgi:hypothetical protein